MYLQEASLQEKPSTSATTTVPIIPVAPKHCHKTFRHNAFIVGTRKLSNNHFQMIAHVDHVNEQHFFDHEIDHIPGMLTACIIRQSVLVTSHIHYQVPFTKKFLMDKLEVNYLAHAKLNKDILVECHLTDAILKNNLLKKATLKAVAIQDEYKIAEGSLTFRIYDPEAFERLHDITSLRHNLMTPQERPIQ